jgi:hypothetical protein
VSDDFDSTKAVVKAYEDGLTGYIFNAREREQFLESQKYSYFNEPNISGTGIGKRALLWQYALKLDQKSFTEAQKTGDCVSHGSRNARDVTRAVEILVNHEPEDWFKRGATEPTYGARGHSGQGMSPAKASMFERDVGFLARHDYGVVDLSKYNASIGMGWGRSGVPSEVQELCRKNRIGRISNVRTQRELMDAMVNGYAAHSGQGAAWEGKPSSKNVHERAARPWNHDMLIAGYDDTKEYWPVRVWFLINSWGPWNSPVPNWPKDYPPQVPGMIVTTEDDFDVCVSSGDCWTYGSIEGYPPQRLPDLGSIGLLNA